jgi:hypothetical protein
MTVIIGTFFVCGLFDNSLNTDFNAFEELERIYRE